ncbi:MAG: ABC transporter substrate-binding protein [Treponema sp.]|nr:ABC transporter substrate-binding protein [Treponema sp.]
MFKKIICLFSIFFIFFPIHAQNPSIRLGIIKGIACAPCAYLIENKAKLAVQDMDFKNFDSAQSELPALLKGEIDVGFLTAEDGAKVFTAGNASLLCLGVAQNGNAFLLTDDDKFNSIEDLKEKNLLCPPNDSSVKILENLLSKKGLSAGEETGAVHLDFSFPASVMANKLITGQSHFALLSEPYATVAMLNSQKIRRAVSLQKIYGESESYSSYPAMLIVARSDFARENPGLLRRFCDLYKTAVLWTNKNPAKAALLSEKHGIGFSVATVRASIPNAALTFRDSRAAKSDIEKYLTLLGRKLPEEGFYF